MKEGRKEGGKKGRTEGVWEEGVEPVVQEKYMVSITLALFCLLDQIYHMQGIGHAGHARHAGHRPSILRPYSGCLG